MPFSNSKVKHTTVAQKIRLQIYDKTLCYTAGSAPEKVARYKKTVICNENLKQVINYFLVLEATVTQAELTR